MDSWGALYERYWITTAGAALFIDDVKNLLLNYLNFIKIFFYKFKGYPIIRSS